MAVLFERSGVVRDAFQLAGWDAWSCDLVPAPGKHIQGDALDVMWWGWDLIIAHPPCQFLSYAGMRYWNAPGRAAKRAEALRTFMAVYHAPCPRVCVENPTGWPCQAFRQPDQTIHPWYFGDPFMKRTCLWLRGLPPLRYVLQPDLFEPCIAVVPPPPRIGRDGKARHFVETLSSRDFRRSRFWPGIASAMAEQWTKEVLA